MDDKNKIIKEKSSIGLGISVNIKDMVDSILYPDKCPLPEPEITWRKTYGRQEKDGDTTRTMILHEETILREPKAIPEQKKQIPKRKHKQK
jgi:hypothetical protein